MVFFSKLAEIGANFAKKSFFHFFLGKCFWKNEQKLCSFCNQWTILSAFWRLRALQNLHQRRFCYSLLTVLQINPRRFIHCISATIYHIKFQTQVVPVANFRVALFTLSKILGLFYAVLLFLLIIWILLGNTSHQVLLYIVQNLGKSKICGVHSCFRELLCHGNSLSIFIHKNWSLSKNHFPSIFLNFWLIK